MERFFSYAARWSTFKADVLTAVAIDRGAAHVLLSVVALVALALTAGLMAWTLPVYIGIVALFSAAYVHSKWHLWAPLLAGGVSPRSVQSLLVTIVFQAILVGIMYMAGFGIRSLIN